MASAGERAGCEGVAGAEAEGEAFTNGAVFAKRRTAVAFMVHGLEKALMERPDANPKSAQGIKKPALHLVPPAATLEAAVRLMASPYGPYNWREYPIAMSVYLSATKRHADSILDGEWLDPECPHGTSHASGLIANGAILIDAHRTGNLIDDRPPPGVTAALIRAFKENGRLPE